VNGVSPRHWPFWVRWRWLLVTLGTTGVLAVIAVRATMIAEAVDWVMWVGATVFVAFILSPVAAAIAQPLTAYLGSP
jgi:hypothetical protein